MRRAEIIVNNLLEGDDEKPKKKLPPWLAKIKGEDTGEEKEGDKGDKAPAKKDGGSKGGSAKSSDSAVGKTW